MADVEMDQSEESAASEYDEEINFVEQVSISDSRNKSNHVVMEFTRGTLFFKDGKLVRHERRKSTTEIELACTTYRRADIW